MAQEDSKYCGCLYYSANALARVMTKLAEDAFATTGLAPSYAFLLMSVNEKPGIQPKEISEHMQLAPSTVTRLIEKLEYKGLLTRNSCGRATEVLPSAEGKQLQPKLKAAWRDLHARYEELIGEETAKRLTAEIYEVSKKLGA